MAERFAATLVYLLVLVIGLALCNSNAEHFGVGLAIWVVASFVYGLLIRNRWAFLVPILAGVPMGIPFGYAETYLGSDAPLIWFYAAIFSLAAMIAVLAGTIADYYARGPRQGPDQPLSD